MARNPSKAPSQRQLRVGEQIRHILSETLIRGDLGHEILIDHGPEISVSEVRVSPDLKNATAYVIDLGDKLDMNKALEALNSEHAEFQTAVNKAAKLKFTPRIKFVYDKSFDEGTRIDEILDQLHIPDDED